MSHSFKGYTLNKEAKLLEYEFSSASARYQEVKLSGRALSSALKTFWDSFTYEYKPDKP
jgi:hypothetical protein